MEASTRLNLKANLRQQEGEVLRAYDDNNGRVIAPGSYIHIQTREPIGNVTVGVGRNLFGKGISQAESEWFLENDTTEVCRALDELIPWWQSLDPARQIVLADMAFNLGAARLANTWPNFLSFVKAGQYGRAALEMEHSRWYTQVPKRAYKLRLVMESGKL